MKIKLVTIMTMLILLVGCAGDKIVADKISPVEAKVETDKLLMIEKMLTIEELEKLDYGVYHISKGYYENGVILKYPDHYGKATYSIAWGRH